MPKKIKKPPKGGKCAKPTEVYDPNTCGRQAFHLQLLAFLAGALLLACSAQPRSARDAIGVGQAAVSVTNAALEIAIRQLPEGSDLAPWEARTKALETASGVLQQADATLEDVCGVLPLVLDVATQVKCTTCQIYVARAISVGGC